MIVVDTNVIAYLLIQGDYTPYAENALSNDPDWKSPILWKSEFRNILSVYMHNGLMELDESIEVMRKAEELLQDNEYQVDSGQVLRLTKHSQCTAYDCEFVALAQNLGVNLLTMDRKILNQFPKVTLSFTTVRGKQA